MRSRGAHVLLTASLTAVTVLIAAGAAACSCLDHSGVAGGSVSSAPVPSAAELKTLASLAKSEAANCCGRAHVTNAVVIPTTRALAEFVLSRMRLFTNNPAYLIVMKGRFTEPSVPVPRGAGHPTGTVMTLTVNAATNEVTDFSVGNKTPAESKIGTPIPLPLS